MDVTARGERFVGCWLLDGPQLVRIHLAQSKSGMTVYIVPVDTNINQCPVELAMVVKQRTL
eukprot:COSAG02_NODE_32020_length_523_cov_1.025943_1_plen_60_part_10